MDTLHPLSNPTSLVISEHLAKGLVIFETGTSDLQMEEIETPRSQSCAEGHTHQASAEVSTSGWLGSDVRLASGKFPVQLLGSDSHTWVSIS